MIFKWGHGNDPVYTGSTIGSCCGSLFHQGGKAAQPERKWKNQYGEGVTPATPAKPISVDMVSNHRGILFVPGVQDTEKEVEGFELKTIKTRNGPVSVSIRTKW